MWEQLTGLIHTIPRANLLRQERQHKANYFEDLLCLICLKSMHFRPTSCVLYSADWFVFLLSAGSFSPVALPRHVSSWSRSCTCQRWVCRTQVCHRCKRSAFPWDGCPQPRSLKVVFGVIFPGSSFSSLSYALSTNGRRECLSPVAP